MIYLDYSATTPVDYEVIDAMNRTYKDYVGNANSINNLGKRSNDLLSASTKQIADILKCNQDEIIFTSGATESNNMAIMGTAFANHRRGKHIITSKLEHPSVLKVVEYLGTCGFEIDYVKNDKDGLINFEHLKELIREDTILVSICAVNSELGIRQPLKMIKQVIKKENSNTYFHSDVTQALGKVDINMIDLDLASASSHKLYGPKGVGLLFKRNTITIKPLLYGSSNITNLRPGTPPLELIVGFSKALRLSILDIEKRNNYIEKLNNKITRELEGKKGILINKTKYSVPQILSISLVNIKPEVIVNALGENEIYISTNTACSSGELSEVIIAVHNDRLRAKTSIRISISHLTTLDEVNTFLNHLTNIYEKYMNLK